MERGKEMGKNILHIVLASCVLLLVSSTLLLVACNQGKADAAKNEGNRIPIANEHTAQEALGTDMQSQNMSYQITRQTYTEKNIKVSYPQLTGLSDKTKQEKINEMLKDAALNCCNYAQIDEIQAECSYEIKWQSGKVLSIVYTGYYQYEGTPHPNNLFVPFTVEIEAERKIELKDLVNVDEDFVTKVKAGDFKGGSPENKSIEIPGSKLLAEIRRIGYFYFTKDSLGINVVVPHSLGDNVQLEVKYQDITNNIKVENEVWKEFLH